MAKQTKKGFFEVNAAKASTKVSINAIMMGSLFFILTLIWTTNPARFGFAVVAQIVLAIPLLHISSLAYSKIGYSDKVVMWDVLGWFTNNIGSIFILNSIGLMIAEVYRDLAIFYFLTTIILMALYSVINIIYKPLSVKEKLFKFFFFLLVMLLGGLFILIG
jgi:hypothetical protein